MQGRAPLLVIAGATGVGKTATAVALARRLPLEVISADSRQVYRGLDVATGKPTAAERRAVPHHLIDVVDPDDRYDAARFRRDAATLIADVRRRGALPAVVGGTGLYIRALLRGLDPAPPADPAFRRELDAVAATAGRAAVHARLAAAAPAVARRLHPNDQVRVVRALELVRAGSAVGAEQARWAAPCADHEVCYVGLSQARERLAARLRARAAAMVETGLLDEVRGLLARGYAPMLPALMGLGYREFVRVAEGRLEPAAALAAMQRDTVRYARRQRTWFEREPEVEWIDVDAAGGPEGVAMMVEATLRRRGLRA
jgi:tRNA dimethylallyltransferase